MSRADDIRDRILSETAQALSDGFKARAAAERMALAAEWAREQRTQREQRYARQTAQRHRAEHWARCER